jgi:predicted regulator of Ras-like GTPase activity (Roadblock/LC7/MglB family)
MPDQSSRSQQLDRVIADLLAQAPEVEAAAVVSFDGLPMASALPATMDEDRVAAMSAALLSLGERAAEGLGRGGLSQVYIEGETGTVFLVSADDEAVLVAVAARGAKVGMMLYEVRRAAAAVAEVLRSTSHVGHHEAVAYAAPVEALPEQAPVDAYVKPVAEVPVEPYAPVSSDPAWATHLPSGSVAPATETQAWS